MDLVQDIDHWVKKKLSEPQKRALRSAFDEGVASGKYNTLKKLCPVYINQDYKLTLVGWVQVVRSLSLTEQCESLGIPFKENALSYKNEPERAAFEFYRSQGYQGGYCEGGMILLLLKSLTLDRLKKHNEFGIEDAVTRYFEAQINIISEYPHLVRDVRNSITSCKNKRFRENFDEIYSPYMAEEVYPGVTFEALNAMRNNLSEELLLRTYDLIASNPYQFRKGWPDLTLVRNN